MTEEGVLLFVDALEDDEVRVLLGETPHTFPRALLPPGTREGLWLRLTLAPPQKVGEEIEARRARLLGSDPGGNIKL
jgi:hypothetical protein